MTNYLQPEDAAHVLDLQTFANSIRGTGVISGCDVTSGTDPMESDISSGTVVYNGTVLDVSPDSVNHTAGDTEPRFDVIYIDDTATTQIKEGDPAPENHAGDNVSVSFEDEPFQYATPVPPHDIPGVPLALVAIPAGATDYSHMREVKLSTELIVHGVQHISEMVLPEYDDLANAPFERANVVRVTGLGSSPEGVYIHDGSEYVSVATGLTFSDLTLESDNSFEGNDISEVGTLEVQDSFRVQQGHGSFNLPEHHTRYGDDLTDREISRRSLSNDERFEVWLLDVNFRGGGTDPDFYVTIVDESTDTVLAETHDFVRGDTSPIGVSEPGADVTIRVTNNTNSIQTVTISGQIYRVKE